MPDHDNGPHTAYARLADKLRHQILAGELQAGQQLPTEGQMSARYSVGRNTAREAFRLLASQGLVTIKRGVSGGAFVVHPTPTRAVDSVYTALTLFSGTQRITKTQMFEVREMLEVPASELAAFHRTKEELVSLRDSMIGDAPTGTASAPCPEGFHERVIKATRNPLLEAIAIPIVRLAEKFPWTRTNLHLNKQIQSEHGEILHHLETQDQAAARESMRTHLRSLKQIVHSRNEDLT